MSKDISKNSLEISNDFEISTNSSSDDSQSSDGSEASNSKISTSISYYLIENLGLGLNWAYTNQEWSSNVSGTTTIITNAIGPKLSFHIGVNEKTNIKIFSSYSKLSSSIKTVGTEFDRKASTNGSSWSIGVGIAVFLIDNISLNVLADRYKINTRTSDIEGNNKSSGASVKAGISVYL